MTALHISNCVVRFILSVSSHPSNVHSCRGPSPNFLPLAPATLNNPSIRACFFTQDDTQSLTTDSFLKSPALQSATKPISFISDKRAAQFSSPKPMKQTRFPSFNSNLIVSAAMPSEPVTIYILPLIINRLLFRRRQGKFIMRGLGVSFALISQPRIIVRFGFLEVHVLQHKMLGASLNQSF